MPLSVEIFYALSLPSREADDRLQALCPYNDFSKYLEDILSLFDLASQCHSMLLLLTCPSYQVSKVSDYIPNFLCHLSTERPNGPCEV